MKHFITSKTLKFKNAKELREFLRLQNPTALKHYKQELKRLNPLLVIDGLGRGLKLKKLKIFYD